MCAYSESGCVDEYRAEVGLTLDKAASVRMSDWSRHQLTPEQIKYAAEDALVALLIYDHLVQLGDVNIEAWSLHWTHPDGSGGGASNRKHPWHHVAHLIDVRWCGWRGRLRSRAGGQSGKKTDTAKARDAEHRLKDPGRLKARKTLLYDNCACSVCRSCLLSAAMSEPGARATC